MSRVGEVDEGERMTVTSDSDIYYDPFNKEIDKDPHRVWRRMRDDAPLTTIRRPDSCSSVPTVLLGREVLPGWKRYSAEADIRCPV